MCAVIGVARRLHTGKKHGTKSKMSKSRKKEKSRELSDMSSRLSQIKHSDRVFIKESHIEYICLRIETLSVRGLVHRRHKDTKVLHEVNEYKDAEGMTA